MSALNLVHASLGRFQTRSSRIVEITGTRQVDVLGPGGQPEKKTVWVGTLMKQDGKTVDTALLWEASGATHNSRGVSSDKDLCIVIERIAPPPLPEAELPPLPPAVANDLELRTLREENEALRNEIAAARDVIQTQADEVKIVGELILILQPKDGETLVQAAERLTEAAKKK